MKISSIIILSLISLVSFAQTEELEGQNDQEIQTEQTESNYGTIFDNKQNPVSVNGFGGFNIVFGSVENTLALQLGAEGAILFDKKYFIGLYGQGHVTSPIYEFDLYENSTGPGYHYEKSAVFGHGGLYLGYIYQPEKPMHFGVSSKIGLGGISLYDGGEPSLTENNYSFTSGPVIVFSPQLDFEMNITSWFKFRSSIGFQLVSSSSIEYNTLENDVLVTKEILNTNNFSSPQFTLGFLFGRFN